MTYYCVACGADSRGREFCSECRKLHGGLGGSQNLHSITHPLDKVDARESFIEEVSDDYSF